MRCAGKQMDSKGKLHFSAYKFMFRARMYRALIPVLNSVKNQRKAHNI